MSLKWRHNERDGVSNHLRLGCSLNCLFRRRSKKTSNLRVTGLCDGNSPVTGEFPSRRASNAQNVFIWWRHHMATVSVSRTMPRNMWTQFCFAWFCCGCIINSLTTHLPLHKTTFWKAFSWIKMLECWFKSHWNLFLRVGPIDDKSALTRVMACTEQAPNHYLNQCRSRSLTHICGSKGRWVKVFFHSDSPGCLFRQ